MLVVYTERMPSPEGTTTRPTRRRRDVAVCLGLIAASFAVYARVLGHGFVSFDDPNYLVENEMVRGGLTWAGVKWAFTTSHAANWHPFTWLSHMLDVELFGMRAGGHHATNVALHGLNAALLFLGLRGMTRAFWPSVLVAALFVLHPLRAESVAWAAERKDVLSATFWMTCLLAWAWYARRPSLGKYAVVALSLALGLMAKPMLVTLPFVLLLLDFWPLRRLRDGTAWRLVLEKIPLLLLVAGSCLATMWAQESGGSVRSLGALSLDERLAVVPLSYVGYLAKTIWPVGLACFYPHPAIGIGGEVSILGAKTIGAILALLVITACAVRWGRRIPYLPVGWFWYLGTLVPVVGLFQVGDQAMADRYAYVPLVGIYLAAVWGIVHVAGSRLPRFALGAGAAAVLVALGIATWLQAGTWRDSLTLFEHAASVTERNYLAHTVVAQEREKLGELEAARDHLEEALRFRPGYVAARNRLGIVYGKLGDWDRAVAFYEEAIRSQPRNVDAYVSLAGILAGGRDPGRARSLLEQALAIDPNHARAHGNLGALAEQAGDLAGARRRYERAIELDPRLVEAHINLAALLQRTGDERRAVDHYRAALRVQGRQVRAARALAWILATSPDASLRNGGEARRWAELCAEEAEHRQPGVLATLAAACAEGGDFAAAVRWQNEAIGLSDPARRGELQGALQLYRQGRPLHRE